MYRLCGRMIRQHHISTMVGCDWYISRCSGCSRVAPSGVRGDRCRKKSKSATENLKHIRGGLCRKCNIWLRADSNLVPAKSLSFHASRVWWRVIVRQHSLTKTSSKQSKVRDLHSLLRLLFEKARKKGRSNMRLLSSDVVPISRGTGASYDLEMMLIKCTAGTTALGFCLFN